MNDMVDYYPVPCQFCEAVVARKNPNVPATCYNCRQKRQSIRAKKAYLKRKKYGLV